MLKLFHGITSVCSIKVRIGLAEIGLDYESIVMDLQSGDQHDADYLRLNPDGVVPTLVDGDIVVVESSLILEYLDRVYNQSRLMPKRSALEVAARHWLLRCIAIHDAINTLTFCTTLRDQIVESKTPAEIGAMLAPMPNPMARKKRNELLEKGFESDYLYQAILHLDRMIRDMQGALTNNAWISGVQLGIVDIALIPYVDRLQRLGFEGLWQESRSGIAPWLAAMQARDSYKREVVEKINPELASRMRTGGGRYWPELQRRWLAVASST